MNVILSGYGQMGHMIEEMLTRENLGRVVGVVHPGVCSSPFEVGETADVLIDFSYPGNLEQALAYGREKRCPLVIGTTGLTDEQKQAVGDASRETPVVFASNYSLGVAAINRTVGILAKMLLPRGFDAEIVETHHHFKADAPSGTAKTLLNSLDPNDEYRHVFGREGRPGPRGREIGVHAVRGGTVAGEHSVFFFGEDETIEVRHSAASRRVFAAGTLRAAQFVMGKQSGLYSMEDVLGM